MKLEGANSLSTHRRRLLGAGLLVTIAALSLVGFALSALRHEKVLVLHEAAVNARAQASRLTRAIEQAFDATSLPSLADVVAFEKLPRDPAREPLASIDASTAGAGTLAILTVPGATYPAMNGELPDLPPPLDPKKLPVGLATLWSGAEQAEISRANPEADQTSWRQVLTEASGTPWEAAARFRLARALFSQGNTSEARKELEQVAWGPQTLSGETGVPLDVLALRSLLQLSEIDGRAREQASVWLDALFHRVLIRWRLPKSILDEWESREPDRAAAWLRVVGLHSDAQELGAKLTGAGVSSVQEVAHKLGRVWIDLNGTPRLLTTHPIEGGTWLVARTEQNVRDILRRVIATESLPKYCAVRISIAGHDLSPADRGDGQELASIHSGFASVAIHLTQPGLLIGPQRTRSWIVGGLIALAAITIVGGFFAAVRAYERQREYSRMQTEFVASVSHELRAPLAAVRLMAEELTDPSATSMARQDEYHRLILREAQRLGMLIENVLRHARLERSEQSLEFRPLDLAEATRTAIQGLMPCAADRQVTISFDAPEDPVMVAGDEHALRQVVVNLLDNALKHSPSGSEVRVGIDTMPESAGSSAMGSACLQVQDHGMGIPASEHKRIFERFYRLGTELRRETAGVGLGLAIVKRLVDAHGGSVTVQSAPEMGSCFTVVLPLVDLTPDGVMAGQASPGGTKHAIVSSTW